jgi:hypothetical protein
MLLQNTLDGEKNIYLKFKVCLFVPFALPDLSTDRHENSGCFSMHFRDSFVKLDVDPPQSS